MVRVSIAACMLVGAFATAVILIPQPYNWLIWIPYSFVLVFGIVWIDGRQRAGWQRARAKGRKLLRTDRRG
jgi:hypothetical protein